LVIEQGGELHEDLPYRPYVAGMRDPRTQPLEATVRVGDRALLLGVGLGRKDDVGVPGRRVLEHGYRDDELRLAERVAPRRPVREVADGVGVEEERRREASVREAVADRSGVATRGHLGQPGSGVRGAPHLAQAAPVRAARGLEELC